MKKIILSIAIIGAFGFASCTSEKKTEKQEAEKKEMNHDKVNHDEKAVAVYQCPMKCEGDKTYADKDVKCPTCNMSLVEVEREKGENHEEDHDH